MAGQTESDAYEPTVCHRSVIDVCVTDVTSENLHFFIEIHKFSDTPFVHTQAGDSASPNPSSETRAYAKVGSKSLKFPCGIIILLPSSNSTWLFMRINLQSQTSDFVDVDLACDHCYGSSKSQKPIYGAILHMAPPEGGQACRIGPLEYSVQVQGS